MFYALDYGPAQNLINLFHTAKKTRCQQLQIIMTRCKMGSLKVTVLICNGTVVLLVTDCQPLIMSKKLRFSYYRSGWLRAEAYKEGKKEWVCTRPCSPSCTPPGPPSHTSSLYQSQTSAGDWFSQIWYLSCSSGSRNFGEGGPRNMKYKPPHSVAIFLWPIFTGQGGGMAPLAPPWIRYCSDVS